MKYRFLAFLIVPFFLSSCLEPDDPAKQRALLAAKAQGDIIVGAAAPWSSIDVLLWNGIELAMTEINDGGGILGRRLQIIKRDDEGSVEKGIKIAQEFSENPDFVAVIGHYQSFVTIPASVVYQYYGILLLSTAAMNPGLTREGFSLIFRTVPDDNAFGRRLAAFCASRGYNGIVVYHDGDEDGRDLADGFETAAKMVGVTVVDRQGYDPYTSKEDFRKILDRWQQNFSFDAIFLAGRLPRAAVFINTAREKGVQTPIIGGLAMDRKALLKMLSKKIGNVFVPTTFNPNSDEKKIQRFVQAFKKRYNKIPDSLAAQGYDTVHMLAYAIKKAQSTSPPEIARALYSAQGFEGLTGDFRFNAQGDCTNSQINIKVVKNGRFEYLPSEDSSPSGTSK